MSGLDSGLKCLGKSSRADDARWTLLRGGDTAGRSAGRGCSDSPEISPEFQSDSPGFRSDSPGLRSGSPETSPGLCDTSRGSLPGSSLGFSSVSLSCSQRCSRLRLTCDGP